MLAPRWPPLPDSTLTNIGSHYRRALLLGPRPFMPGPSPLACCSRQQACSSDKIERLGKEAESPQLQSVQAACPESALSSRRKLEHIPVVLVNCSSALCALVCLLLVCLSIVFLHCARLCACQLCFFIVHSCVLVACALCLSLVLLVPWSRFRSTGRM